MTSSRELLVENAAIDDPRIGEEGACHKMADMPLYIGD
jgi:hypothetical protein